MSRRRILLTSGSREPEPPVLLSWEHVLWSIENNRYKTDYSIGDLIPLDLGTEGQLNAQIADFDHDDLANGTGKARISFITKELCSTTSKMNSKDTNVGGWENSLMRTTTIPTIWNKFPNILQESIVEVAKKSSAGNKSTTIVSTNDKLWMPSLYEVDSSQTYSIYPYEGTTYPIFTDASSRIKTRNATATGWWARSPNINAATSFQGVNTNGSTNSRVASDRSGGIAVGFCL